ncbi:hypothetical protein GCM10010341_61270 [Streptomyces noursei]|nr:hypothetical protein GCM10010341_61270 [Streptomyces noursei]
MSIASSSPPSLAQPTVHLAVRLLRTGRSSAPYVAIIGGEVKAVAAGAGGWTHRRAKDSAPQPHPDRPDRTGRDPDARGPRGLPRGELPRSPYETLHGARGQAERTTPAPEPEENPKRKGPLLA